MKSLICFVTLLAAAYGGVLSGAGDLGVGYGSSGGHSGGGAQAVINSALSHLSSSGFLSGGGHGSSGAAPIIGGSSGHGPIVSGHSGTSHYKLNLPINNPGLSYTANRPVQVLRPATLRVVARPVSVNVVKSVSVEEHAPRTVQGTLFVNKPTTVTVAKPVTVNLGGQSGHSSSSGFNLGGASGLGLGGHSGSSFDLGSSGPWASQDPATLGW